MTTPQTAGAGRAGVPLPPLPPAVPQPIPAAASALIYSGECLVTGWSVSNSDAAAGHPVQLLDGTDATGVVIDYAKPASNGGTDRAAFPAPGILCRNGIFFTGSGVFVKGTVWFIPL